MKQVNSIRSRHCCVTCKLITTSKSQKKKLKTEKYACINSKSYALVNESTDYVVNLKMDKKATQQLRNWV